MKNIFYYQRPQRKKNPRAGLRVVATVNGWMVDLLSDGRCRIFTPGGHLASLDLFDNQSDAVARIEKWQERGAKHV
jgi:hypothetical protein